MACERCARWQGAVKVTSRKSEAIRRTFSTSLRAREGQTSDPTEASQNESSIGLSILEHKRRPVKAPNDRVRSAAHAIDVSQRLGTRLSRPVIGNMEWQTSTYHYNKQTSKTLPVLANTTNELLEAYAVLEQSKLDRDGKPAASKLEIAKRRKDTERVFVSNATVKDYGHKLVINAFVHDAKEKAKNDALESLGGNKRKAGPRKPGSGRRRAPGRPSGIRSSSPSSGFRSTSSSGASKSSQPQSGFRPPSSRSGFKPSGNNDRGSSGNQDSNITFKTLSFGNRPATS